ncbi:MAG: ribbon-helix-helix domain-containing protein [Nanoarchaeota archaeon]|nr:ribbon-helix-helix domain-containing protein [Nanoarchaeota archaeon]
MKTVCLKMEQKLLHEIDTKLKNNRYATRTEFIRDAIRSKLTELEKEEIIRKLTAFKGSLKGKGKMSDEEAGEIAIRKLAKKFKIKLD